MLAVLLLISLFTISGGLTSGSVTRQEFSTGKLAGHTGKSYKPQVFYRSFLQQLRTADFRQIFLSSSKNLILLLKSRMVQIEYNTNLVVVLLLTQLPAGCLFIHHLHHYPRRKAAAFSSVIKQNA